MSTIDVDLFNRQMVALDYLIHEDPDAVRVSTIPGDPADAPHDRINVHNALVGLRNLGDEIQDQLQDDGIVVLQGV